MKELAIAKLNKELAETKGNQYINAIKQPVRDALAEFCAQSDEFAQAVYQGGHFKDCMGAVVKGVGQSISDIEAYRRAVGFYFPGADVRFQMSVDLCASVETPPEAPSKREPITLEMFDLL